MHANTLITKEINVFKKFRRKKSKEGKVYCLGRSIAIYIQTGHSWQCKKKNSVQHDDQHTDEQQSLKSTLLNICQARR